MPRTFIGPVAALAEGEGRSVKLLPGLEAYVFRYHGTVRAFINRCTHMGGPLTLDPSEERLVCGWHEAAFDPDTGERCLGQAAPGSCLTKITVETDAQGHWLAWSRPADPFDF